MQRLGVGVSGFQFRVSSFGRRAPGVGFLVSGLGVRVPGLGVWVWGVRGGAGAARVEGGLQRLIPG